MEFYIIRAKDKLKTYQSRRIWTIYWTRDFRLQSTNYSQNHRIQYLDFEYLEDSYSCFTVDVSADLSFHTYLLHAYRESGMVPNLGIKKRKIQLGYQYEYSWVRVGVFHVMIQ